MGCLSSFSGVQSVRSGTRTRYARIGSKKHQQSRKRAPFLKLMSYAFRVLKILQLRPTYLVYSILEQLLVTILSRNIREISAKKGRAQNIAHTLKTNHPADWTPWTGPPPGDSYIQYVFMRDQGNQKRDVFEEQPPDSRESRLGAGQKPISRKKGRYLKQTSMAFLVFTSDIR